MTLDSASSSTSKHFAETPQLSGPAHTALRQKILDHEGYIQERLHIGRLERDRDRARRDLRTEKDKTKAADRRLQKVFRYTHPIKYQMYLTLQNPKFEVARFIRLILTRCIVFVFSGCGPTGLITHLKLFTIGILWI